MEKPERPRDWESWIDQELNLKVPSPRFQRSKINASREIARLTEGQRA
jgi:hypothetical protein